MTPSERRFAPTTVRQPRNGVRYGLEQVSAFIGIRSGAVLVPRCASAPQRAFLGVDGVWRKQVTLAHESARVLELRASMFKRVVS
jgi:hypothetical protein